MVGERAVTFSRYIRRTVIRNWSRKKHLGKWKGRVKDLPWKCRQSKVFLNRSDEGRWITELKSKERDDSYFKKELSFKTFLSIIDKRKLPNFNRCGLEETDASCESYSRVSYEMLDADTLNVEKLQAFLLC